MIKNIFLIVCFSGYFSVFAQEQFRPEELVNTIIGTDSKRSYSNFFFILRISLYINYKLKGRRGGVVCSITNSLTEEGSHKTPSTTQQQTTKMLINTQTLCSIVCVVLTCFIVTKI